MEEAVETSRIPAVELNDEKGLLIRQRYLVKQSMAA